MTNSNTNTTTKLITTLTILFAFTGLALATSVNNNNAAQTTVAPGTADVPILDFTVTDGGDVAIANGPQPGDSFTDFGTGDNVYFNDDTTNTGWSSSDNDALWLDNDDHGTYEASGRSIGGTITLDQNGYSQGSQTTEGFVFVTGTNEDIVFSDDGGTTTYTADLIADTTLTSGTVYSGSEVATAIKAALESKSIGSDTFTVSYDAGADTFSIQGNNQDKDGAEQLL